MYDTKYIYIYTYIRKLPCSDVHPRENDKAAALHLCISVHSRILLHVFCANLRIVEFGQVRASPCARGGGGAQENPYKGGGWLAKGGLVP